MADSFTRSIYAAAIFSSRHGLYRNEPSVKIARSSRNVAVVARAAVGADTVSSADSLQEDMMWSVVEFALGPREQDELDDKPPSPPDNHSASAPDNSERHTPRRRSSCI